MAEIEHPTPGDEAVSPKSRIGRLDYYYDARTFTYKTRKSSKPKERRNRKYAVVVRRSIDERGQYTGSTIEIRSEPLCRVLLEINEGVEGLELYKSEPEMTPASLYFSYPGLKARLSEELKKTSPDNTLITDILAAIHLVEEDQGHVLEEVEKLASQKVITWVLSWALFKPNCLAHYHDEKTDQPCIVIVRQTRYETMEGQRYLIVEYEDIRDDGRAFGYARGDKKFKIYEGAKPISELAIYPFEFHPDREVVYARAVELGKLYNRLPTHAYFDLAGKSMRHDGSIFFTTGRIMISPSTYRTYGPETRTEEAITYGIIKRPFSDVSRPADRNQLSDDEYAICTPVAMGFAFNHKQWGGFPMARIRDVVWNEFAFDSLVLGQRQKSLIHSLVRQHATEESSGFDDIIAGKGRGLIGMLAGKPGCGKTLTAEAVAEVTHRPLYAVSVGELGTEPDVVEERLIRVLELAHIWNAVLLLDEAEVFLQKRSVSDVTRNALVSIFLRQLEYYQGILILTTNIVEQCDYAFESRIHFSVHYPELDRDARRKIWATFFKRQALDVSDTELDELAEHRINGRQIKNAFSSAQTIALAKGTRTLTTEDVKTVLSVLQDWQSAIRDSSSMLAP